MAWAGMIEYSDNNGQPGDEWGDCLNVGHCVEYFEQNATAQVCPIFQSFLLPRVQSCTRI